MKDYSIQNINGELILEIKVGNNSKLGILKFWAYLFILVGIGFLGVSKHILTLLPMGLVIFLTIKPLLWSAFGKEKCYFRKNSIALMKDYTILPDKKQYYDFSNLDINFVNLKTYSANKKNQTIDAERAFEKFVHLKFIADEKKLISSKKLPLSDAQEIANTIAKHYNIVT